MKYTKEQLQDMNDAQINIALAELLGFNLAYHSMRDIGRMLVIEEIDGGLSRIPDYCNNWNDVMPLAIEHDVAYLKTYKAAYCGMDGSWYKKHCADNKPQRAIACCLILVLQEK